MDYETTYAFVRHVLSMDSTPHGNGLMKRGITSPSLLRAAYALIVAGEGATVLGTHESRTAKVICSEAIWRVVARSMQILGGLGITDDTIVARIFRDVRPFRIYDGPSEVHRWSIARRTLRAGTAS